MNFVKSTFYLVSLTTTVELPLTSIISKSHLYYSFLDIGLFRITTLILGAILGLN